MDLAVPMYRATRHGSPLHLAVEALSLASLSKRPGMQTLDRNASQKYSQAVRSVSRVLHEPDQATSNATLEAIMLLSSYEANSSSDNACEAWANHIEGAGTLIIARGADQFRDGESLSLFRAVRTQLLANSIQKRKPMPDFPGPKGWAVEFYKSEASTTATTFKQNAKLALLLSRTLSTFALDRTVQKKTEVEMLLDESYELMEAMAEQDVLTATEWRVRTVANPYGGNDITDVEQLNVWPLPYMHVYKDLQSVCTKNDDRINHMTCSSIVIDAIKWLHPNPEIYKYDRRYLTARARIQMLVDDICASVPYCWYGETLSAGQNQETLRQRTGKSMIHLIGFC